MSDRSLTIVMLLLVLGLPVSALLVRRVPTRDIIRYAAVWVGIIIVLYDLARLFT